MGVLYGSLVAIHGVEGRDATGNAPLFCHGLYLCLVMCSSANGLTIPSSFNAWMPGRYTWWSSSLVPSITVSAPRLFAISFKFTNRCFCTDNTGSPGSFGWLPVPVHLHGSLCGHRPVLLPRGLQSPDHRMDAVAVKGNCINLAAILRSCLYCCL